MGELKQLNFERTRRAVYLRFTEEEYQLLNEICKARGEKVQDFIRSVLFREKGRRPLFNKEESKALRAEINRIGVNFNQIAKKLNSGFRQGWSNSFETCAADIQKLRKVFTENVAS